MDREGLLGEPTKASTVGDLNHVTDPVVKSTTTDPFGNVTVSEALQNFEVHGPTGQAKMMSMTTNKSETTSIDGSVTTLQAPYTMTYTYNAVGIMTGAVMSGQIHNKTVDAFGNITHSYTTKTFVIVAGQAKVKDVTSRSVTTSVDGTVTITDPYTTTYYYYGEGATDLSPWDDTQGPFETGRLSPKA